MAEISVNKNYFYIETYGCTSNKADSNIMISILQTSGYIKSNMENAKYIIINTCAVKEQTENKIKARLKQLYYYSLKNIDKKIIITGCLPHITNKYIDIIRKIIPNFSAIIDMNSIIKIISVIREIDRGKHNLIIKSEDKKDKSYIPITYFRKKITGIVPISEGCLGACTYCCVKNARGKLKCYNPENIINNVKYQLKQGIKQIYLTSQDCSIYQYDKTKLSELIKKINDLDNGFFLRIGMINPSFLLKNFNQLLEIFQLRKVYQFLHIPIQSGSNRILKLMNRSYLISDILKKINDLRNKFPYLTISTDIICGFPEETEYDFYHTINVIKWLRPEIINISKFTPRPGTKAKKMNQVDSKIIKNRSIRLSDLFRRSLDFMNQKWIGWEGIVLLLHKVQKNNQAFGRNFAYKNIFIDKYTGNYGEFVKVKIYKIDGFNLHGKII